MSDTIKRLRSKFLKLKEASKIIIYIAYCALIYSILCAYIYIYIGVCIEYIVQHSIYCIVCIA